VSVVLAASIEEANPQQILERREKVTLPPLLIMQGAFDDNIPAAVSASIRSSKPACINGQPQRDRNLRARATVREFIAKQFNS